MGESEVRNQLYMKVFYEQVKIILNHSVYGHIYMFYDYSEIPHFPKALTHIHSYSS